MATRSPQGTSRGVGLSREELEAALAEHSGVIWHYVHRFHRRYLVLGRPVDVEDLYQEAVGAMVRAALTYDRRRVNPETGRPYTFSGFGGRAIQQTLEVVLQADLRAGMRPFVERPRPGQELPRVTSFESLRWQWREEEPSELGREDKPPGDAAPEDLWRAVERTLPTRQHRQLVRWMYRDGLTASAAARRLGVTRQRACQVRDEALALLRGRLPSCWAEEATT